MRGVLFHVHCVSGAQRVSHDRSTVDAMQREQRLELCGEASGARGAACIEPLRELLDFECDHDRLLVSVTSSAGRRRSGAPPSSGGFRNIGTTCYINAVLASLLGLPPLVDDVLRLLPLFAPRLGQHSVYCALHTLVHQRSVGDERAATPRRLKDAVARRSSRFSQSDLIEASNRSPKPGAAQGRPRQTTVRNLGASERPTGVKPTMVPPTLIERVP